MFKAIVAGIIAGLGAAITGASDGHFTLVEGLIAILAFFTALGGVFGVSNK